MDACTTCSTSLRERPGAAGVAAGILAISARTISSTSDRVSSAWLSVSSSPQPTSRMGSNRASTMAATRLSFFECHTTSDLALFLVVVMYIGVWRKADGSFCHNPPTRPITTVTGGADSNATAVLYALKCALEEAISLRGPTPDVRCRRPQRRGSGWPRCRGHH